MGRGNYTTKTPISILRNYMNNQSLRLGNAKQMRLKTTPFTCAYVVAMYCCVIYMYSPLYKVEQEPRHCTEAGEHMLA